MLLILVVLPLVLIQVDGAFQDQQGSIGGVVLNIMLGWGTFLGSTPSPQYAEASSLLNGCVPQVATT